MLNEFSFIGNLTKKPELRQVQKKNGEGVSVTTLTVAIDRKKANIPTEGTDFFDITVWGRTAENCSNYLDKGSRVLVKGYIVINTSEKDGQRRFFTQFTGQRVVFLSNKQSDNGYSNVNNMQNLNATNTNQNNQNGNINSSPSFNIGGAFVAIDDGDIPF